MRIARVLALAGLDSRRKCETFIRNGAVTVNGEVVRDLGRQVDIENDAVLYRGKPVVMGERIYYILNKPEGYVTTAGDTHAKKTVYDILPHRLVRASRQVGSSRSRVFPVGRLDRDSMGLLLFTNDGDLAHRLTHPRYGVGKWYEVRLHKAFDRRDTKRLLAGISLHDGLAKVEKVEVVSPRIVHVLLREGKNREVRRIFEALEYGVVRLLRFGFGPIFVGQLPLGQGRYLNKREVQALRDAAGGGKEASAGGRD